MPVSKINKAEPRLISSWMPVVLCMVIIFILSSVPGKDIPPIFVFQDVVYHLLAFFFLAYFFAKALKNSFFNIRQSRLIIFTLAFGLFYGITDEFHQLFVPFREFSGMDIMFDGIGSLLGGLLKR